MKNGEKPEYIYPTITVSRDPGSGGRDVAKRLAKELNMKYLDRNMLLKRIIKKAGLNQKLVEKALEEKTVSPWEVIVNSFLGIETMSDFKFIKTLTAVLLEAVAKEPVVVVGRGANFILPPMATLRLRVTAPRRVLIRYAMQYEKKSAPEARNTIDEFMKTRRDFVYKYFSRDITKAHYYDLCLSTEYLSIDQCVEIAKKAFKVKFRIR
jgi:cytidylate kinase